MKKPLVSICSITYNHEPYIRKCLEGFLSQKTNFDFEILIHDDASTDKTAELIKEFQVKYPDIIKPIYQSENQFSKGVKCIFAKYNFSRAKGRYIAMCEGDDYWIDPLKLQKQVDFLEENESFIACGCYVHTDRFGELEVRSQQLKMKKTLSKNIVNEHPFPTLTTVFRKIDLTSYLEYKPVVGDIEFQMYLSQFGDFMCLDFIGGVYRYHGNGVVSGDTYSNNVKKYIKGKVSANIFFNLGYEKQINKFLYYHFRNEFFKILKNLMKMKGDFKSSFDLIKYILIYYSKNNNFS